MALPAFAITMGINVHMDTYIQYVCYGCPIRRKLLGGGLGFAGNSFITSLTSLTSL